MIAARRPPGQSHTATGASYSYVMAGAVTLRRSYQPFSRGQIATTSSVPSTT